MLDTNVVSELMRAEADAAVIAWIDRQPTPSLHLSAVTVGELLYGVHRLPAGRRKTALSRKVVAMVDEDFRDRVLPYDGLAAAHFADIAAHRERIGRPVSGADAQIAAICRSHGAVLATRNLADFDHTGVEVIDPWNG